MCALFVPVRFIPASGVVGSEVCVCYSAGWHPVPKFRTHKDVFFCMSVPSYNKNTKLDTYMMELTFICKIMIEFKGERKGVTSHICYLSSQ